MIKDMISFTASGVVSFYAIKDNNKLIQLTSKNAILPNAKYLVSRLLMKDAAANITNIRVFNGGVLLVDNPITSYTYVNPNEVQFEALIPAPAFSGAYTKAVLGPSDPGTMGDFSNVTGLALNKNLPDPLLITWNIKII